MKKILVMLLLCVVASGYAQNWEGIINWKISSVMDEATKAKMDEAQKKMNDPATQAQMREMKEKMNDPQFKAMMESNPQMKAQIEQMLKMVEGGETSSLLPKGMVLKIKGQNTLAKMEGGMMGNMEILYLKDKNTTYRIDRESKSYSVLSTSGADTMKLPDVKITKTAETATILNYPCTKYVAESVIQGQTMQQIFWTTTAIKDLDMKSLSRQRVGNSQQAMFYEKIDGVPLKIEMKQAQIGMTMEVTEIKKQSLPAAEFAIPTGFQQAK